jgi:ribonuclease-3
LGPFSSWFTKIIFRTKSRNGHNNETPVIDPIKLIKLKNTLGINFKNTSYYAQALTHRSYLECDECVNFSNERLEFLGDSVLSVVIATYLFENYPEEDEGFLTKIRAKFVNKKSLGKAADRINLGSYLIIGNNLQRNLVNNSVSMLADALEALIGAIYMDRGIEVCKRIIYKIIIEPNLNDEEFMVDRNYKSQLLEYTQANKIEAPVYEVIKEEGPQHERIFTVRVSIANKEMGTGTGRNKKTAEQNAAKISMKIMLADEKNKD